MRSKAVDRSQDFRVGWIAAFFGFVLILGLVFWAIFAYGK